MPRKRKKIQKETGKCPKFKKIIKECKYSQGSLWRVIVFPEKSKTRKPVATGLA